MLDAVVVAAVRTPIGKRGGALSGAHPTDLSATVLRALVERTGFDPALVGGGGQANASIFELL
jgi:acetyl-CoA acyltransferase